MAKQKVLNLKSRFLWLFCLLFLWLIFSLTASSYLDPDFGWHFKTGEWIWQNQAVPKTDLFSYTMPGYILKYPAWLSELIIYRLYSLIGYQGLAFAGGFLAAAAFMLAIPFQKISFAFFPLLLAGLACLDYISIRPTMIGYFLASVVFFVLRKSYQKRVWFFLLPFLFLIWANFHGSFFIGLGILVLSILTDLFLIVREKKRFNGHLKFALGSLFLSLLATLINPYSWRIYEEVFLTLFSRNLHFQIVEWLPYSRFDWSMIIYTSTLVSFLMLRQHQVSLFEKITSCLLLLAGFSSQRLMIYFIIFSLPLLVSLTKEFYFQVYRLQNFKKLWRRRWLFLIIFCLFVSLSLWAKFKSFQGLREEKLYPAGAVEFLRQQNLSGNFFSSYNWGGYLIWKLPEKKVFIDGRMAIWKQGDYSVFKDAASILSGAKDYRPIFDQYSIETVLLPAEKRSNSWLEILIISFFSKREKELFSLTGKLIQDGWQLVYQDEVSQVLLKPKVAEKN